MPPHASDFQWSQVFTVFITCLLVLGGFVGLVCYRRNRRKNLEKAPQREKILRPAGYSAMLRLDEANEEFLLLLLQALAAAGLAAWVGRLLYAVPEGLISGRFRFSELGPVWASGPFWSCALLFLALSLWVARCFLKASELERAIRNWRFGMRGEQAVAEKLGGAELAKAGYTVFHDVPGEGKWNVDHVVVGPGGVFVLETKARARRKPTRDQPEHYVYFDGTILDFPWCYDDKAVRQAQRNADWVRALLLDYAPPDLFVLPIVLLPGWFVQPRDNPKNYAVKAMNPKDAVSAIRDSEHRYSEADLRGVRKRLDEACRTLEF